MKIIFKKTMLEKLNDVIHQSRLDNKEIEKIVLNKKEWEDFKRDMDDILLFGMISNHPLCDAMYDGVNIELEPTPPMPEPVVSRTV